MTKIDLNGKWQGKCIKNNTVDFTFDGTVPGCVHTDLVGNKIPADIYYRNNSDECRWIEECDFEYSKKFTVEEAPEKAMLVFEGLDVYTDVYLNKKLLASTDNMFITHHFDISHLLKKGENEITVYFYSPVKKVENLEHCNGAFTCERMHTRRMQFTYGWDWAERFVTCGICRDVYIDTDNSFRVKNTYIYTESISDNSAEVVIEAEFENYESGAFADVKILSPDGETVYSNRFFRKENFLKEHIDIPDAKLWYPAGYGKQPLYKLIIGSQEFTFGIRTAKILQLPDKKGSDYYKKCLEIKDSVSGREYDRNEDFSGFQLLINSTQIMCMGANWVPCESFVSAETDEKITELLTLAKEAGVNMLRVWGGGVFEKQHFYNECDRLGILVTQDFLMACGEYPEYKEEFIEHMKKEAEFAAISLRNHPSLVWWSGDNENAINGYDDAEDYHGRTAIHKGIFPVLNRLDPKRRFLLSSPCGGTPYASKTKGTTHNTQYLGCSIFPYIMDEDMVDYKEHFSQYLARFIAEEPTMGAVNYHSLKRFMTDEDIFEKDEMWNFHTKSNPGLPFSLFDVLINFTEKVLGKFTDGRDRFFKMKYAQYEWIRISMENIRRNRGFINGIVYWMWNDCWPASSGWAFVDYYCLPKASFYSFKRCASELIASIDKKDEYEIYLCNNSLEDKDTHIELMCLSDGKVNHIKDCLVTAKAECAEKVLTLPLETIPENAILICNIKSGNITDRAFYKSGALEIIPCDAVEVISKTEDSITIKAKEYVHATEFEGEYIFDDNYFSLLPDETRTVKMRKSSTAECDEILIKAYTIK
ncbi:MAG: hypothetical protein IJ279_03505 [Clostridia bacterium]|nr:hypothetical protein [Clostridia bacterium]